MTPHPCFLAVPMRVRISVKFFAPWSERKQPEIFSLSFIIRPSRLSAWVVGERHIWIGQEAQNSLFVVFQPLRKVVPDATLGATGTGGCHSASAFALAEPGGLREKCDAARNDGIVAPSEVRSISRRFWGLLFVPTQMLDTASTTQQRLHKRATNLPARISDSARSSRQVVRIGKAHVQRPAS